MGGLRIGLVGAGHIAGPHLAAWRRSPGCRLAGIHDLDRAAAARLAARHGVERSCDRLEELIEACDVIDVCTPPGSHAALVGAAVEAGRHVLCEKPIVTELAEWERLAERLAGSPSRLAVVHNLKFARAVRRARRWVERGRIGRLLRLSRHFLTDPASDRMLARPHWSHDLPGGRWFETMPHALYLIHHFLGPLEVAGLTALRTAAAPPGAPADEVVILFRGADALADVHYSAGCGLNRRQLTLWGSRGRIEVDLLADSAVLSRRRDRPWRRAVGGLDRLLAQTAAWPLDRVGYLAGRLPRRRPHALLIRQFARHLQGRADAPTPLEEIDYVVRTAQEIGREIDRQVGRTH